MVKTITITENAYEKINAMKRRDESFSELFGRLAETGKGNVKELFGLLKKSEAEIATERKRWVEARKRLSKGLAESINARA